MVGNGPSVSVQEFEGIKLSEKSNSLEWSSNVMGVVIPQDGC